MTETGHGPAPFSRPLRVAFVIDALRPGAGTENQLMLLLSSFDRRRIAPVLVCLRDEPGGTPSEADYERVSLDLRRLASARGLRGVNALRRRLRGERFDLVVTFFRDGNLVGTVAGFLAGVPVVSNRRNLGYWHDRFELGLLRGLNRLTDFFVANSEAARRHTVQTERVRASRIVVIPNAVDTDRFRPRVDDAEGGNREVPAGLPAGRPLVGCVANLRQVKGHESLIRAFRIVGREQPDARLILIGEGPERRALESLAVELELAGRVVFLGARNDVPRLLRRLDLGVLSSRTESASNSLLEYLASGLPIVATAVGGSAELIRDGSGGWLVPPGDPDRLARAISAACADPGLRAAMGRANRDLALARFSRSVIVERWQRFLEGRAAPPGAGRWAT